MDYSAANTGLWNFFIQMGIIAGILLLANALIRKSAFIRKSLIPTSVLAGFVLLGIKSLGIINIPANFLEMVTYHGIAVGFIALSLRTISEGQRGAKGAGLRSGAVIISTYLVQALVGLGISIGVAVLGIPGFFKAAGILLPMSFGQGPGQANNVGITYEALSGNLSDVNFSSARMGRMEMDRRVGRRLGNDARLAALRWKMYRPGRSSP